MPLTKLPEYAHQPFTWIVQSGSFTKNPGGGKMMRIHALGGGGAPYIAPAA